MMNQSQLIGTWDLLEHSEIDENLQGRLIYDANNKISVHITGLNKGVDVLISYSGTYYLENVYVIHRVAISDNPKRIGTEQRRYIQLNGKLMTFTESPTETSFKIVWEKE